MIALFIRNVYEEMSCCYVLPFVITPGHVPEVISMRNFSDTFATLTSTRFQSVIDPQSPRHRFNPVLASFHLPVLLLIPVQSIERIFVNSRDWLGVHFWSKFMYTYQHDSSWANFSAVVWVDQYLDYDNQARKKWLRVDASSSFDINLIIVVAGLFSGKWYQHSLCLQFDTFILHN